MIAKEGNAGFQAMNKLGSQKTPFLAIISFDNNTVILEALDSVNAKTCKFRFPEQSNTAPKDKHNPPELKIKNFSQERYESSFKKVLSHIKNGDSYLCNLSCEIPLENTLKLSDIFDTSEAKYKIFYQDKFVCFSPESFIQIKENKISTFPMKGTIDASIPNAEEILIKDKKELAEHYTITDLLRNDLSMVSENVRVEKFRYIDRIKTSNGELLQSSSVISGTLKSDWQSEIGNMLQEILPAGSITGAPKKRTCEIIEEAETHDRGFYTGVCVLFDGETLDSFVMIRMIIKRDGKFYYKSGGGITSFSECEKEYKEVIQKVYVPVS